MGNGTYSAWSVVSWIVYWKPLSANFITVATASLGTASNRALAAPNTTGITDIPQPTPRRARSRGVTTIWNRNDTTPVAA